MENKIKLPTIEGVGQTVQDLLGVHNVKHLPTNIKTGDVFVYVSEGIAKLYKATKDKDNATTPNTDFCEEYKFGKITIEELKKKQLMPKKKLRDNFYNNISKITVIKNYSYVDTGVFYSDYQGKFSLIEKKPCVYLIVFNNGFINLEYQFLFLNRNLEGKSSVEFSKNSLVNLGESPFFKAYDVTEYFDLDS